MSFPLPLFLFPHPLPFTPVLLLLFPAFFLLLFLVQKKQALIHRFFTVGCPQIWGNNIKSTTFVNFEGKRKPPIPHAREWRHRVSKLFCVYPHCEEWVPDCPTGLQKLSLSTQHKVSSLFWNAAPTESWCLCENFHLSILLQDKEEFIIFHDKLLFSVPWDKICSWWNCNIQKNSKDLLQLSAKT